MDNKDLQFDFTLFKQGISKNVIREYEHLVNVLNKEELSVLGVLLNMGKKIDKVSEKKIITARKSLNTYFTKTFKNNFNRLEKFLLLEDIPFNETRIRDYSTTSSFCKNDELFVAYIDSLDFEQIKDIKNRLLKEGEFSKSFVEAIKTVDNQKEIEKINRIEE